MAPRTEVTNSDRLRKMAHSSEFSVIQDLLDERADIIAHHWTCNDTVVRLGKGPGLTAEDRQSVTINCDQKLQQIMTRVFATADAAQRQKEEVGRHNDKLRKIDLKIAALHDEMQDKYQNLSQIKNRNGQTIIQTIILLALLVLAAILSSGVF